MKLAQPAIVLMTALAFSHFPLVEAPAALGETVRGNIFLMEDDLAYARFLELMHDGSYRQVNRDRDGSAEVDRGTWTLQGAGTIALHSTCHALRVRGVFSGPLSVAIANPTDIEALRISVEAIEKFEHTTGDKVFAASALGELNGSNAARIDLRTGVETFSRDDLVALAGQLREVIRSEGSGTYYLVRSKSGAPWAYTVGAPPNAGSTTTAKTAAAIRAPDSLKGKVVPFCFTPVDAGMFAREVGSWQPFHLPGGLD